MSTLSVSAWKLEDPSIFLVMFVFGGASKLLKLSDESNHSRLHCVLSTVPLRTDGRTDADGP